MLRRAFNFIFIQFHGQFQLFSWPSDTELSNYLIISIHDDTENFWGLHVIVMYYLSI